jgi:hypothetical protein
MKRLLSRFSFILLGCFSGCSQSISKSLSEATNPFAPARYVLSAERTWQLNSPDLGRFDASGLAFTASSDLITVNDRGPEIYKIVLSTNSSANLKPLGILTLAQVLRLPDAYVSRFDTEGVAVDADGNIYTCEESRRWVLRYDLAKRSISHLQIDFSSVAKYFSLDRNASFEGIAIGNGKLYLANERDRPRIIVVDLSTLKIIDDFEVTATWVAFGGPHYSDLSWFEAALYILDRNHRAILKVDPPTHKVLAEYSFERMELAPEDAYKTHFPTGTMEGLAVDAKYFWLVTDNNGLPRIKYPADIRPTLFRCLRPDAK